AAVIAVGGGWGPLAEIGLARKLGRPVVLLRSWRLGPPEGQEGLDACIEAVSPEQAVALALEAAP
ncbi:MAG: cluster4 family, partial [Miltoncostaeaceae bacterium]|nr:cluster4 family [Miltoncostaeaceae bacterium]